MSRSLGPASVVLGIGLLALPDAAHGAAQGAALARAACPARADVLAAAEPLAAPIRPADCGTVTQTPPEFTWPAVGGEYTVTLTFPDGRIERRTTRHNWLAWDRALPSGDYRWRVKAGGVEGAERRFTIAAQAVAFVLPDDAVALRRAREAPHPRSFARGPASPIAAMKSERARGFAQLAAEVDARLDTPVEPEPASGSKNADYDAAVAEHKRALNAALAWAVTKSERYGADAARRLTALAHWSTAGSTSFAANDMASRTIAWTLALGYDWAHDYLTFMERQAILGAIADRTRAMHERYVASGAIASHPYDSHGNLTLTITAAIAALVAGDLPEADAWFRDTVRLAAVWTSPWGGADGGFANGTMQGQWDTGSNLLAWYVLRNAARIDLSRKDWVRNHARYLAYFAPPGAPAGLFGDGQEDRAQETRARVGKALARFAPTPLARWYAAKLEGEDPARLELLLAPRAEGERAPLPEGTPPAAAFPSIGWVAMHSDLADPGRTSVYFRSSPYGSYNHGHADQNGFVIDHAGERLAIKSGYYDDYRTPHWEGWYKQTRSANAITFDGGQGQRIDGKEYAGEITRFASDGRVDYAVGHAEAAYGGALTRALRTLVYLRPNVVLVHDAVASDTPRTWEWNLHALEPMQAHSDTRVTLRNGRARMCVEMLASPPLAFSQTDRFAVAPKGDKPKQWHGTFATRDKSRSAEFIALMRIGAECAENGSAASAARDRDGWTVDAGDAKLRLAGEQVTLLR